MILKKKLFIIAILLLLIGCNKQKQEIPIIPVPEEEHLEFGLTFQVVIPYDTTLNTVGLEEITYFPDIDQSQYITRIWDQTTFSDTMWIKPPSKAYIGCRRQIAVGIQKTRDDPNYFARRYVFAVDTIMSKEDSVIIFHWPDDTLKAISKQNWF